MKKILFAICFLLVGMTTHAQRAYIMHAEGLVKVCKVVEPESVAKRITFGSVGPEDKLILNGKVRVKMVREDGTQCELTEAGIYPLQQLKFSKLEGNSFLSQMGGFIKSFFEASHSSESKSSYKSTVHAISRGEHAIPILQVPFEGWYPWGERLEFFWQYPCDTCTLQLAIYDMDSKTKVLEVPVMKSNYAIEHPEKHFKPGKKYFWKIEIPGKKLEYAVKTFQFTDKADFHKAVRTATQHLDQSGVKWDAAPRYVYTDQFLLENYGSNYQWLYSSNEWKQNKKGNEAYLKLLKDSRQAQLRSSEKN